MNIVVLTGRPTDNPEVKQTQSGMKVAKYTLAVDRAKEGTDFLRLVAFDKQADFAEKYIKKGKKYAITGRIQTGSYKNREGQTVYTTDIIVDHQEFCERKDADEKPEPKPTPADGVFVEIPDGIDAELPFE